MNSLITPYFTQKTGSTLTSNIIAATICLIAWLMAIILFFFDREMDVRENKLLESEGFGDDHKSFYKNLAINYNLIKFNLF